MLAVDDSTPDEPYARSIELAAGHRPGKHHAVARGIDSVSLPRAGGDRHVPCDDRVYDEADGATENDRFAAPIRTARGRGFTPR